MQNKKIKTSGQSLIEILVALGIGVILIGGVTALISVNLKGSAQSKTTQVASSLTQEVIDSAKSIAEANWNNFYGMAKGPANKYYIASSTLTVATGTEPLSIGGYDFTRYFYIENVNRTQCGIGSPTTTAATVSCNTNFPLGSGDIAEDPSTQRIVVVVEWSAGKENIMQVGYVSRARNAAIRQTDWSGGGGDASVLTGPNNKYFAKNAIDETTTPGALQMILSGGGGNAVTPNMDATEPNHWAWNDAIGWIDFNYGPGNMGVNNNKLFGYASSSVGLIAFDCATTPNGDICASPSGSWNVSNVGTALRGWAYNDAIGWISFDSVTATSTTAYGVTIDPTGEFKGFAWNDAIGWISMNCDQPSVGLNTCATVPYRVKTSWTSAAESGWITSPIFDLGGKAALNAVIWKGVANGGAVRFQIAASNVSTGPWNDADYKGPDGTSGTSYSTAPDTSTVVSPRDFGNVRFVRYKAIIESNAGRTQSPTVNDIIIGYSL